jgi:hypothetical protein
MLFIKHCLLCVRLSPGVQPDVARKRKAGDLVVEGEQEANVGLEATQGQMDGFFSQLPYECHLEEVASVGD